MVTSGRTGTTAADQELLKRAVVALERKLREAQSAATGLERELVAAQTAAADLPSVQAALQQARAAAGEQQRRADELVRDLTAARAEASEAAQQRDRVRAALEAAEAAEDERSRATAQRRAEEEVAALELARARGQAEVLAAQVQQLEVSNSMLRQDNQQHAERLRQAFEREGELLAELAELQAKLRAHSTSSRHQPPPAPGRKVTAAGAVAAGGHEAAMELGYQACTAVTTSARTPGDSLGGGEVQVEQQLLMAAAHQLAEEYAGRLAQAEGGARQLEQQLQALSARVEHLQRDADRQAAAAAAAREEAAQERRAAQLLLDNNLRLHEAVAQLMDEGPGCWGSMAGEGGSSCAAAADEPEERAQGGAATAGGRAQHQRQREQLRTRNGSVPRAVKPGPCAEQVCQAGRRTAAGEEHRWRQRGRQLTPAALPPAQAEAVRPHVPARKPAQTARLPLAAKPQTPAVDPAAQKAAVKAALALSSEHRELHSCYRAVVQELRRVASALPAAPTSKQLALLRQHAALQQEQHDIAEQLEDKVVQLAALKQSGGL